MRCGDHLRDDRSEEGNGVDGTEAQFHFAGFDTGDLDQIGQQCVQPVDVLVGLLEEFITDLGIVDGAVDKCFDVSLHREDGRPELVRDVSEELAAHTCEALHLRDVAKRAIGDAVERPCKSAQLGELQLSLVDASIEVASGDLRGGRCQRGHLEIDAADEPVEQQECGDGDDESNDDDDPRTAEHVDRRGGDGYGRDRRGRTQCSHAPGENDSVQSVLKRRGHRCRSLGGQPLNRYPTPLTVSMRREYSPSFSRILEICTSTVRSTT